VEEVPQKRGLVKEERILKKAWHKDFLAKNPHF
jgi:hypothetical protein